MAAMAPSTRSTVEADKEKKFMAPSTRSTVEAADVHDSDELAVLQGTRAVFVENLEDDVH